MVESQYKIVVFCPLADVEKLIHEMSGAGAGAIGNYKGCAFVTKGTGYWQPTPGAHPTSGEVGKLSREDQYKIEMICPKESLIDVISAIRKTHSYETPEINIISLTDETYQKHQS